MHHNAASSSWTDLARADSWLAERGRALLYRGGEGAGLLATVRDGSPPRLHPVNAGIVDGRLFTFIGPSAKLDDLEADGRYALHAHLDPAAPSEFAVRGHAVAVEDAVTRDLVALDWFFSVDDTFRLFELSVEQAQLGERASAEAWPPAYRRWSAPTDESPLPRSSSPNASQSPPMTTSPRTSCGPL